jgi:beta-carotene ketolase (CrtW type)
MARLLGAWLGVALLLQAVEPARAFNVLVFWTVPLVISSLQLFVFGTYLPHRGGVGDGSGDGRHQVQSLGFVRIVSLLACYHFGYHWEHHAFPEVPWFRLPELRRAVNRAGPMAATLALSLGGALPS